jgi:hypothetical protein
MAVCRHEVVGLGNIERFDSTQTLEDRLKKLRSAVRAPCKYEGVLTKLRAQGF